MSLGSMLFLPQGAFLNSEQLLMNISRYSLFYISSDVCVLYSWAYVAYTPIDIIC